MNIDWSKAPEATHYDMRPGCSPAFMRKNHNGRDWEYLGMHGHWTMYGGIPDSQLKDLLARPVAWSGEGLPPVGTVCIFNSSKVWDEHWHSLMPLGEDTEVTIIAHCLQPVTGITVAVFTFQVEGGLQCEMGVKEMFSPIRTAEQIAAEERDAAIAEMISACAYPGSEITRKVCEEIYAMGYRKQAQP